MKNKLASFYQGEKGAQRLCALQKYIDGRILAKTRDIDKILIWTPISGFSGGEIYPFSDNQRAPFGNGVFDHIIIIHCFDVTREAAGLMAEASRMVREHGIIDVIGWTKPKYDHDLPVWERKRYYITLNINTLRALRWRRYEKVQDLMTLTFTGQKVNKKMPMPVAAMPSPRNASSDT